MNLFEKRYLDKIGLRKIKGQKEICKESASTDRMDYIKSYFTIFFILICFRLILEVFAVIYQKYSNAHNVTLKYLKHDYIVNIECSLVVCSNLANNSHIPSHTSKSYSKCYKLAGFAESWRWKRRT